jgi:hypothetical protein
VVCPACGHKNTNDSTVFCAGCGKPISAAAAVGVQGPPSSDHLPMNGSHARKSSRDYSNARFFGLFRNRERGDNCGPLRRGYTGRLSLNWSDAT